MNENKSNIIRRKIQGVQKSAFPRVLDLFSGCGGLSLGFHAAGFKIIGAVESDDDAAKSHGVNFHNADPIHCIPRDITKTSPHTLAHALKLGESSTAIDVIIGGPPCQAFARVGRSKLREVAEHPEAFRHDPRARLYIDYLSYVDFFSPLAVVMENVPDMLNHGGHNIAGEVCDVLSEKGYVCGYTLLNAAFYGVPQMRERMFLIAIRKELAQSIIFPSPTHWIDLPTGYEGSRAVALKLLSGRELSGKDKYYRSPPLTKMNLLPAITAFEAIGDLPPIFARRDLASGVLKRGARRFDSPMPLSLPENYLSAYARLMREWPAFEGTDSVSDHVIRYLPRDYELFARLRPGDQYPQASKLAYLMFAEALEAARINHEIPDESSKWKELKDAIVPPYDPGKFPNKWRKMESDKPSRTLLAHLGKDGYSHIHYDSEQARTISVREAARLQSFPDGFRFSGTMNPAFRQIGNAVPPLLARAVADALLKQLRNRAFVAKRTDRNSTLVGSSSR